MCLCIKRYSAAKQRCPSVSSLGAEKTAYELDNGRVTSYSGTIVFAGTNDNKFIEKNHTVDHEDMVFVRNMINEPRIFM